VLVEGPLAGVAGRVLASGRSHALGQATSRRPREPTAPATCPLEFGKHAIRTGTISFFATKRTHAPVADGSAVIAKAAANSVRERKPRFRNTLDR
jgi:hypothetical protein